MNVVIIEKQEIHNGKIVLSDHRAAHIVKILKCREGDSIKFGVLGGKIGTARIISLHGKFPFRVELDGRAESLPPPKEKIDFLLALPRPIMLRRILSQIVALGVQNLHIVNANRVEKSFWDTSLLEQHGYMEHLVQGLEQAVDTIIPEVIFHRRFKPFVEDYLPTIKKRYSDMLVAHPESDATLGSILGSGGGRVLVAVGPEGGWVDYEVAKLQEQGFSVFNIGCRILKVDTAVVNIHGRVMSLFENGR
ncbi:MAG: 16S rRNA (uracil(1498)-N(3))-methyltransferase [Desulfopila sp.]|jgi:RsmE family RNA methyltransferase|nr:16S rRNA (uracil(1498)-N(3))-methyltransferase [Desulfopila sp.]